VLDKQNSTKSRSKKKVWIWILILIFLIGGSGYWFFYRHGGVSKRGLECRSDNPPASCANRPSQKGNGNKMKQQKPVTKP
jgi:hypothetical protein